MSFTPLPHRIETLVAQAIAAAQQAGALSDSAEYTMPPVTPNTRPELGHYGLAAMPLAGTFRMKPLDIAQIIVSHLPETDYIDVVKIAPPGFINIFLSDSWVVQQVETIIQAGPQTLFAQDYGQGQTANVEFVSANPTGPIHVGRTRGAVVGDTVARLLEACGWNVHREYYFNNGGRQMQLLGETLQRRYLQQLGEEAPLSEDHYQGGYLVEMAEALAAEHGESLREKDWTFFKEQAEDQIFQMIEATLARIGVRFDLFFNELDLYDSGAVWQARDALREAGYTYEAAAHEGASDEEKQKATEKGLEPATWFRSTAFGDDQDRVIVRANGEPTYVLPDVAYHINKIERGFDRLIDVFGADHFTEAQTVRRALEALGHRVNNIDVILTQWVHLVRGGEKVGMSTRQGQYVTLDDLVDDIGPDAVRYFMLDRSTDSTINFDLDLAVKQSNENPVFYIQNAHVRCAGILREVTARGYAADWDAEADLSLLNDEERAFVVKMLELPEAITFAYDNLAPHHLATWALDLARQFHPLYERSRVLHTEVPEDVAQARLRLYKAAKVVFRRVLGLMGMHAPEEM